MEIEEEIAEEKKDEDMVLRLGGIMRMAYDEELEEKLVGRSKEAGKRRKNWRADSDKMEEVLKLENVDTAILNIYSPPRINAIIEMWKLLPGWSVDFTALDPDDGQPWDFNIQEKRDKAERLARDKCGLLVIGSPMCSAYDQMQKLNKAIWNKIRFEELLQSGMQHLRFHMKLYRLQMDNGFYFMHEYQEKENNDEDPTIRRLIEDWRVYCVKGDICKLNISQEEDTGRRLDRKRTIFVTNAEVIASRLARKCLGGTRSVNSMITKSASMKCIQKKIYSEEL
jgi:hypothetical protein